LQVVLDLFHRKPHTLAAIPWKNMVMMIPDDGAQLACRCRAA